MAERSDSPAEALARARAEAEARIAQARVTRERLRAARREAERRAREATVARKRLADEHAREMRAAEIQREALEAGRRRARDTHSGAIHIVGKASSNQESSGRGRATLKPAETADTADTDDHRVARLEAELAKAKKELEIERARSRGAAGPPATDGEAASKLERPRAQNSFSKQQQQQSDGVGGDARCAPTAITTREDRKVARQPPERQGFLETTGEKLKLNQYWYSKATIAAFVAECKQFGGYRVAFLSTPSVYFSLDQKSPLFLESCLFEFDRAFSKSCPSGGFVYYDYRKPEEVPTALRGAFDMCVIDPPHVTRDVLGAYATTASILLAKPPVPLARLRGESKYTPDLAASDGWLSRWMPSLGCKGNRKVKTDLGRLEGPPTGDIVPGGALPGRILISSLAGREHKAMMERLFGVFPRVFLPRIPNLIYQYHVYTNYFSARLNAPNPDQPKPDPRKTSARSRKEDFGFY